MAAETGSGMMVLATVALVIPAIYASVTQHHEPEHVESISLDISFVLILTYVASLVFSALKTHQRLFAPADGARRTQRHARGGEPGPLGAASPCCVAAACSSAS